MQPRPRGPSSLNGGKAPEMEILKSCRESESLEEIHDEIPKGQIIHQSIF